MCCAAQLEGPELEPFRSAVHLRSTVYRGEEEAAYSEDRGDRELSITAELLGRPTHHSRYSEQQQARPLSYHSGSNEGYRGQEWAEELEEEPAASAASPLAESPPGDGERSSFFEFSPPRVSIGPSSLGPVAHQPDHELSDLV